MKKNNIACALLLLFSETALHASAVNMKAQNTGKLLKGAVKIIISSIVGFQSGRYVYKNRKDINTEEEITIALLNIPNIHFFISGCSDIRKAIKNWQK